MTAVARKKMSSDETKTNIRKSGIAALGALLAIVVVVVFAFHYLNENNRLRKNEERYVTARSKSNVLTALQMKVIKYDDYGILNESNIQDFARILIDNNEVELVHGYHINQRNSVKVTDQYFIWQHGCLGYVVKWIDGNGIAKTTAVRHMGEGNFETHTLRE